MFLLKDFYIFARSLEYIEQNLCTEITQDDIAAHCCCCVSALQKMWKYCTHIGVMNYVKKRRLTLAARDIVAGANIFDTAVKYCYGSNEAFHSLWGVNPSEFAKTADLPPYARVWMMKQ